ncbi:hypothetical protein GCM10027419_51170 [Pandoraea terrae]
MRARSIPTGGEGAGARQRLAAWHLPEELARHRGIAPRRTTGTLEDALKGVWGECVRFPRPPQYAFSLP